MALWPKYLRQLRALPQTQALWPFLETLSHRWLRQLVSLSDKLCTKCTDSSGPFADERKEQHIKCVLWSLIVIGFLTFSFCNCVAASKACLSLNKDGCDLLSAGFKIEWSVYKLCLSFKKAFKDAEVLPEFSQSDKLATTLSKTALL